MAAVLTPRLYSGGLWGSSYVRICRAHVVTAAKCNQCFRPFSFMLWFNSETGSLLSPYYRWESRYPERPWIQRFRAGLWPVLSVCRAHTRPPLQSSMLFQTAATLVSLQTGRLVWQRRYHPFCLLCGMMETCDFIRARGSHYASPTKWLHSHTRKECSVFTKAVSAGTLWDRRPNRYWQ